MTKRIGITTRYRAEFRAWCDMRNRCYNKTNPRFKDYGGRGIRVCECWRHSFQKFLSDMGPRPGKGYSLDRINNDMGYRKSNCRWATPKQQLQNTRKNQTLTYNGETLCFTEWARRIGGTIDAIRGRIKRGWTVKDALTTPLYGKDTKATLITFNGKTQSLTHWAREFHIKVSLLSDRLRVLGWDIEKALTTSAGGFRKHARYFTKNGITKSVAQWAREIGIAEVTVRTRIRNGWSIQEALFAPVGPNGKKRSE
ncbi:MAG: hypothetical protein KGL39_00220 [Patescibacteria group bacterium]|nr:hypothetical protein [Patescibacteria group bacterium]